jgi:hypothetical protein
MAHDYLMEAVRAANTGHHHQASAAYQNAGNQERPYAEKQELWKAADRHRRIAESD